MKPSIITLAALSPWLAVVVLTLTRGWLGLGLALLILVLHAVAVGRYIVVESIEALKAVERMGKRLERSYGKAFSTLLGLADMLPAAVASLSLMLPAAIVLYYSALRSVCRSLSEDIGILAVHPHPSRIALLVVLGFSAPLVYFWIRRVKLCIQRATELVEAVEGLGS